MRQLAWLAGLVLIAGACAQAQPDLEIQTEVVATGLLAPIGLAETPDGRILVAEDGTGEGDESGGISVIGDGEVRRVVSGFPSGRDSGDLSGSAMVGVDQTGTVYIGNFGAGHLWTVDVDVLLSAGEPLGLDDLGKTMQPLGEVRLTNPFDITFDPAERPVVADASQNGVATQNDDGTTRFLHRFAALDDPNSSFEIDPVPTGIERVGDEYFVTLTGGCPYPDGSGQLVAIKTDRSERVVADELFMPIDIAMGPDGTLWLLEFADFDDDASCFTGTGYLPGTGRLSRLTDDGLEVVVDGLDHPGAVLPASDGRLYISEVFSGRVLALTLGADSAVSVRPQPRFVDVASAVGIDFEHRAFFRSMAVDPVASMGGGVCWLDFDRDGWMDLYLVNSFSLEDFRFWRESGGVPASRLYRNRGGEFEAVDIGADVTVRGNGCLATDLNGDGWTDLYVTVDGPNLLLLNDRGREFTEVGESAGVDTPGWSTAAAAGDLNGDGLIDLFVASYLDLSVTIDVPTGHFPQDHSGIPDFLYLGTGVTEEGIPQFRDATVEVGLERADRGLGAVLSDLDLDGDLDLYVANDGHANRLFLNEAAATLAGMAFVDVTEVADVGDSGSGMGIAAGDFDEDGRPDLLVTNWNAELHALYRSDPASETQPGFRYSTYTIGLAGLGNDQTGWGAAWLDVDLDTDLDLFVVNGHVPVTDLADDAELMKLYINMSAEGELARFTDGTAPYGLAEVGVRLARGSAVADFDNDGDLDIAVNSIGGRATLLRNDGAVGHWLIVVPEGMAPGTVVEVSLPDGVRLRREILAGSSYLATDDPRLHFGLGEADAVDVTVTWPDGRSRTLSSVKADEIVAVDRT